ncbi:TPA: histidinol phosphate phosphatase domain-containing protein [Candidatus Poribacteria bacterium]|nr:histidinol phosphate phosphatase domain-containing protein [Candidatus Poribacteria bacterium]
MIDFHTHTIFSDGELLPSELVRRAEEKGYRFIALTDHLDRSNFDFVIPRLLRCAAELNAVTSVRVLVGAEITHVPPPLIPSLVEDIRRAGAQVVVAHGETLVEPVTKGTNRAAIEAGVDILAHPGLIEPEDVRLAAEKGVYLEISSRKGHSLANGHVAKLARLYGAKLLINTDSHSPSDLITLQFARKVGLAAGLSEEEVESVFEDAFNLAIKLIGKTNLREGLADV